MATYLSALENLKQTADYNWHAATLESYYSALSLTLLNKVGLGPRPTHLASSTPHTIWTAPTLASVLSGTPTALASGPLRAFLCDLPDRYREIVSLYDRATILGPAASVGFCPQLSAEAALRMAKLLTGMHRYAFDGIITNGAACVLLSLPSNLSAIPADTKPLREHPIGAGTIAPSSDSSASSTMMGEDLNPAGSGVSRVEGKLTFFFLHKVVYNSKYNK